MFLLSVLVCTAATVARILDPANLDDVYCSKGLPPPNRVTLGGGCRPRSSPGIGSRHPGQTIYAGHPSYGGRPISIGAPAGGPGK